MHKSKGTSLTVLKMGETAGKLMSAQVEFMATDLALLSLPLESYPLVFHGLVKLILEADMLCEINRATTPQDQDNSRQRDDLFWDSQTSSEVESEDYFCNVTFTPHEVSIICPCHVLDKAFGRVMSCAGAVNGVEVAESKYHLVRVDGEGRDDSTRRISEVSSLLAKAKIPIFFLSAYFSDYILVPKSASEQVRQTFAQHGFTFTEGSLVASLRDDSPANSIYGRSRPTSPEISEKVDALRPSLDSSTRLLLVGSRAVGPTDELELAIFKTLVSPPTYFSLTLHGNEYSCIIDSLQLARWPTHALLGSPRDYLVPISINLAQAPIDVIGVAADVSSRLLALEVPIHYVSTAHSCVVMVPVADQAVAAEAFTPENSS